MSKIHFDLIRMHLMVLADCVDAFERGLGPRARFDQAIEKSLHTLGRLEDELAGRAQRGHVDWASMTPAQVQEAMRKAPFIGGAWVAYPHGPRVALDAPLRRAQPLWWGRAAEDARESFSGMHRPSPSPSFVAVVNPKPLHPEILATPYIFEWNVGSRVGKADTEAEAKAAVDAILRERGYVLLGDP